MPEWNLVPGTFTRLKTIHLTFASTAVVGVVLVVGLTGCSKMKSTSLADLVDQQPDLMDWTTENRELLDQEDPFDHLALEKSVDPESGAFWSPPNKIEVSDVEGNQSSLDLEDSPLTVDVADTAPSNVLEKCQTDCGCQSCRPRGKLKLALAEPIEPPAAASGPPAGILSQPLSPILFNAETRAVRLENGSDLRTTKNELEKPVDVAVRNAASPSSTQKTTESPRSPLTLITPARDGATASNQVARKSLTETNTEPLTPPESSVAEAVDIPSRRIDSSAAQPILRAMPKLEVVATESATQEVAATSAPAGSTRRLIETDPEPPFAAIPPPEDLALQPIARERAELPKVAGELALMQPTDQVTVDPKLAVAVNEFSAGDQMFEPGVAPATPVDSSPLAATLQASHETEIATEDSADATEPEQVVTMRAKSHSIQFSDLTEDQWLELFDLAGEEDPVTDSISNCARCSDGDCPECEEANDFAPLDLPVQLADPGNMPGRKPDQSESEVAEQMNALDSDFVLPKTPAPLEIKSATNRNAPIDLEKVKPIGTDLAIENGNAFQPAGHVESIRQATSAGSSNGQNPPPAADVPSNSKTSSAPARLPTTDLSNLKWLLSPKSEQKDNEFKPVPQAGIPQSDILDPAVSSSDAPETVGETEAVNRLVQLRQAVAKLEQVVGLRLNHAQFCTAVHGFGQLKPFPSTEFDPQQRMLIYCEVENYRTSRESTPDGDRFVTRLQGRYEICDRDGTLVQEGEFPAVEDIAMKKRRDFYMYFPVTLDDLATGEYELKLEVTDLTAKRDSRIEPALKFTVK